MESNKHGILVYFNDERFVNLCITNYSYYSFQFVLNSELTLDFVTINIEVEGKGQILKTCVVLGTLIWQSTDGFLKVNLWSFVRLPRLP